MVPLRVDKPWGYELVIADNSNYGAKVLFIRAGQRLSLQRHSYRNETWYVQAGLGYVTLGEEAPTRKVIAKGDIVFVPNYTWHRIAALTDLTVFEAVPRYVDGDTERHEDDYGRA